MGTEDCWQQMGVWGDRTCERLVSVGYCSNCPVYTATGRSLLDREIPRDYLQEWTQTLAQPAELTNIREDASTSSPSPGQTIETHAAVIFRLGRERFALPVGALHEITRPVPIHTLPHRSNALFLGLVNIRGEILPCVSLSQVLEIDRPIDPTYSRINLERLMVIGRRDSRWVVPVDEVYRVHRFHTRELQAPPVVTANAPQAYTQAILNWHPEKVNYLNADRLLDQLDRRLL